MIAVTRLAHDVIDRLIDGGLSDVYTEHRADFQRSSAGVPIHAGWRTSCFIKNCPKQTTPHMWAAPMPAGMPHASTVLDNPSSVTRGWQLLRALRRTRSTPEAADDPPYEEYMAKGLLPSGDRGGASVPVALHANGAARVRAEMLHAWACKASANFGLVDVRAKFDPVFLDGSIPPIRPNTDLWSISRMPDGTMRWMNLNPVDIMRLLGYPAPEEAYNFTLLTDTELKKACAGMPPARAVSAALSQVAMERA